jgi:hypothetical protein
VTVGPEEERPEILMAQWRQDPADREAREGQTRRLPSEGRATGANSNDDPMTPLRRGPCGEGGGGGYDERWSRCRCCTLKSGARADAGTEARDYLQPDKEGTRSYPRDAVARRRLLL